MAGGQDRVGVQRAPEPQTARQAASRRAGGGAAAAGDAGGARKGAGLVGAGAQAGVLDHCAGRIEAARVAGAGLGQDDGGADRRQAGDAGDQAGELELVEDAGHALLDVGELAEGMVPVAQGEAGTFQGAWPLGVDPKLQRLGVGRGGPDRPYDPQTAALPAPAGKLTGDRAGKPGLAEPAERGGVAGGAGQRDLDGGAPGERVQRLGRCLQDGWPGALQQVASRSRSCWRQAPVVVSWARRPPSCRRRAQTWSLRRCARAGSSAAGRPGGRSGGRSGPRPWGRTCRG